MLKTNGFSEAKSCQSPIGRRRRQTPGKKFRKPPLDFLLETLLYTKHYRLSNIKKSLLYKFLAEIKKKQVLDVKFLNLREKLISNYKDKE